MNALQILGQVCMAFWVSAEPYGAFEEWKGIARVSNTGYARGRCIFWRTRAVVSHDRALDIAHGGDFPTRGELVGGVK